jgi:hypothetical protein
MLGRKNFSFLDRNNQFIKKQKRVVKEVFFLAFSKTSNRVKITQSFPLDLPFGWLLQHFSRHIVNLPCCDS